MERQGSISQSKLLRQNTAEIKAALQDASVYRDRRSIARLIQLAVTGALARLVARLLVSLFFLNLVASEVETWHHMHSVEAQQRMLRWREPGQDLRPLPFPVFHAAVVLPAAILTALGILPWLFGGVLLGCLVWRDARLMWVMVTNLVLHKGPVPELLLKQVAMVGSTLLVMALSARESPSLSRATGLLQPDIPRRQRLGVKRSATVLLGRLMVAALLLFAGVKQFERVYERWPALPWEQPSGPADASATAHHFGRKDARDNNWLLLECVLALPLALGLWTAPVSLLLAVSLLGEAVAHWQWWGADMPSWTYRQSIREHFFVNVAAAGGLVLMQSFGGGVLSVDALLQKDK